MVSSGESGAVVDSGAGTIVWVRRRNGSWWPGRILGPEDLSAAHLMSPRSGTPVKLLGREDASVDWYNLEKSKRVKAFRCGEFDDCIERAEASQGLPAKKREKYARREDAILHALELEKQFFEKKYLKLVKPKGLREKSSELERKNSVTPVRALENCNGKLGNYELCQLGRKVDKSSLMEKNGVPLLAQKAKDAVHPGLEDHNITLGSQVRGLQDLRLKAVPMSRVLYSTASEDSNRTAIDRHAYAVSGTDPYFENSSDSDSKNSIGKGKRPQDGYVEESIPKRHHGLHPVVNIRQNCAELSCHSVQPDTYGKGLSEDGTRFSVYTPAESSQLLSTKHGPQGQMEKPLSQLEVGTCHSQHVTFAEETVSGSSEETESDSSETHSIDTRVEAGMLLSDAETRMRAPSRLCDRVTMQSGQESTSEECDELSLDDRSQFHYLDQNASGAEVSKWQLKGKRNVRNLGKRPMDKFTRTYVDARGRPLNQRATSHSQSYYLGNDFANDADFSEDDFDIQTHGFGQRVYLPSQVAGTRQSYFGPNVIDWELAWGRPFRGYWEERGGCFSPTFIGRNGLDMLIDVDLKVQANRQGEHVPWVSLMSKLNGKAIIGHPIQIETLKDGSTDILLTTNDEFRYDSDRGKVPPVWRTARRTANVRVPRPNQSSQLNVEEDTDSQHLHQSGKVRSRKSPVPNSVLSKIAHSHASRSPQGMKKAPKKGYLPSNQKTKPLSLIGLDHKVTNKTIEAVNSGPLTVACIPVKLAFSRLLEAVGRPPSGPGKHGVSLNSNKDRNPS